MAKLAAGSGAARGDGTVYITRVKLFSPLSVRLGAGRADRGAGLAVVEIVHTAKDHTAYRDPYQHFLGDVARVNAGALGACVLHQVLLPLCAAHLLLRCCRCRWAPVPSCC